MTAPLVEPSAAAPAGTTQFGAVAPEPTQAPQYTPAVPENAAPYSQPLPDSTATAFAPAGTGISALGLERREPPPRTSNTAPLDWAAFVLAFVLPPIGLITAIVALVMGARRRGFGSGIAKAAVAIAVVLSVGVGIGGVVLGKMASDQASHDAVAASSRAWCAKLASYPGALKSDTYGWPAPADTIADSLTPMKAYVKRWTALEKIAPKGIETGTKEIASTAQSVVTSVSTTQTLNDSSNVSTMQDSVANSGVPQWVSEYCN